VCSAEIRGAVRPSRLGARAALLASIVLASLLSPSEVCAQTGPFLYVPNFGDVSVSVVDTPTNTVAGSTITVGTSPATAAVRGDESLVYVANNASNSVSVVSTATNTIVATISVGSGPGGVAVSPNGTLAYVTNFNSGNVSVINAATNTVTATIVVGSGPDSVAVSPDGTRAYVTNATGNTVSVINTATNTVAATVSVGTGPIGVAVSPDGTRVYVPNQSSNNVSVINTATNAVIATISVGSNPFGVAFSPNGTRAYVTNGGGANVSVINTATDTVIATIPVGSGPGGVSFSPDGTRAYVANSGDNTVSVINTTTNSVSQTLLVGNTPLFSGIYSNGNALLAAGLTFKANTSGALACTLASGASGATGPVFTGGTLQFGGANIASALPITLMAAGGTFDTAGNNAALSGGISGLGGLTKIGLGTLALTGTNSYSGNTIINAGTLLGGAVNTFSAASATTVNTGGTLDLGGFAQTINAVSLAGGALQNGSLTGAITSTGGTVNGIGGGATLTTTAGNTTLLGANAYTGATAVNGGTLDVIGSITNSSSVTVNAGGTLSGTGNVDSETTTINSGGTLAPGNAANPTGTLTITGNLAFQSGALYVVQVTPSSAASTVVSGTATLTGGTVNAQFASGSYLAKQYTILTAASGLGGTRFASLTNSNLPAGFTDSLGYSGNSVLLDLTATLGEIDTSRLNQNQKNVVTRLNNFFNGGGTLPPAFVNVFGLSGSALGNALTQLDGEAATGAERAVFQLTNEFLTLMLDPFVNGRTNAGVGGPAIGFAADQKESLPPDIALAYASILTKAPPPSFEQRWTAWGSAYGGANNANGDPAAGSNNITASTFGFAGGMDYHLTPYTVVGFALAGAGTNWGLANVLGSGRSDALQAGAYGISWFGPAYLAGALSLSNHWFTTNRSALGDALTANFVGQGYGARLEAGYRYAVLPAFAVTPYGAVQFQDFHTPAYSETDVTAGSFGLSYAAMNATDVRTELGARFDDPTVIYNKPLILFGRLAWAHDFVSNPALSAGFEALPGGTFTVNGAPIPQNSALTTLGAQLFLTPYWTLLAKFEGEFAPGSQTYAGTGTLRYTW
jgi:YVTN family beta-propeller protein/autotransporter-associated beta strand protein